MAKRESQNGFTLIEIMIVVAIIAVLAAIVIPQWSKSAQKGKADPEIRAMFGEIQMKEEQYRSEQGGAYTNLSLCPLAVNAAGVDLASQACFSGGWVNAHILPTDKQIRCTYQVVADPGSNNAGAAINVPSGFTLPANAANYTGAWYYVLGTCDMDGQGGTNATFLSSSWDTSVQKQNYGQ